MASTPNTRTRCKKLTYDTAQAIHHTCRGLVALVKNLLTQENFEYVLLGKFSTDPLEKEFGKLRRGSGGICFINTQQLIEKVRIFQTKEIINICPNILADITPGHSCNKCDYNIYANDTHEVWDIFKNLDFCFDKLTFSQQLN